MSNTFFQWREKIFKKILVGFAPLVTGLIKTNKFSFSDMLWKEHICDRLRKVVPQLNKHDDVIEWKFMKIAPPPKWRAGCTPGLGHHTCRMTTSTNLVQLQAPAELLPEEAI